MNEVFKLWKIHRVRMEMLRDVSGRRRDIERDCGPRISKFSLSSPSFDSEMYTIGSFSKISPLHFINVAMKITFDSL